ncbi:hypothetical protein [Paenibacillus sp. 481]|uniref:hypothetical protein n=1 Tax=Paenibacillus sp. 481 TaxID=2835869 RepID=UPI001E294332|nr:hypothetical protein [Paenibacillus sp. 481]UHA73760.1 hypothetical protein KIK04_00880 [Paenibacillus sp. 481]
MSDNGVINHFLTNFNSNNLQDFLKLFELLQQAYQEHDEHADLLINFLSSHDEKLVYPLVFYISNEYDVDKYYEHFSSMFENLQESQLKQIERNIIENTPFHNELNLEAVRQLLQLGTQRTEDWKRILECEKQYAENRMRELQNRAQLNYQDLIKFGRHSLMGMSYHLKYKYQVEQSSFNIWLEESDEYKVVLQQALDGYVGEINDIMSALK